MRQEALTRLQESDGPSVRDRVTQAVLTEAGITAALVPDPAVLTAALFGPRIAHHAAAGEPLRVRERFPQGYVAVQFAAEFGDDATLKALARQLDRIATDSGLGITLFRAGAAPWHDDLAVYRRLISHLQCRQTWLFQSLDLWDLCALLAHARLYLGSSLHGRIIAACYGVPGVTIARTGPPGKQAAYLATWDADAALCPAPGALAAAAQQALTRPPDRLAARVRIEAVLQTGQMLRTLLRTV
jgi:polysaccharide pyruvyl transferase WcaK-like protein